MNELKIFECKEFGTVRTIKHGEEILFCGRDIAKALGYSKPQNAISTHCKGALKRSILTNGGCQNMIFLKEGDVYRLIVNGKLPSAERFERWVFDEVLPSIRKHGAYAKEELLDNPDLFIEVLKMNRILHNLGIQYKQGEQWLLYSKYHDKGYTHSETFIIPHSNGTSEIKMITKWTQKGRLFLYQKLEQEGIIPNIEKLKKEVI